MRLVQHFLRLQSIFSSIVGSSSRIRSSHCLRFFDWIDRRDSFGLFHANFSFVGWSILARFSDSVYICLILFGSANFVLLFHPKELSGKGFAFRELKTLNTQCEIVRICSWSKQTWCFCSLLSSVPLATVAHFNLFQVLLQRLPTFSRQVSNPIAGSILAHFLRRFVLEKKCFFSSSFCCFIPIVS